MAQMKKLQQNIVFVVVAQLNRKNILSVLLLG